jgi:hypothetical protein
MDPEILVKDAKKCAKAAATKNKKTETPTQKRKATNTSDDDGDGSEVAGIEDNDKKKKHNAPGGEYQSAIRTLV